MIYWFGGGLRGEGYMGGFPLEEFVMGEEKFNEVGAGFSSIIVKKKQWKNKYEKVFSAKHKDQH